MPPTACATPAPPPYREVALAPADRATLAAAVERTLHALKPGQEGSAFQATNPGQGWRLHFDGRGFTAQPRSGSWQWGLELARYGYAGTEAPVIEPPALVSQDANRVTWDRGLGVQEWYINDRRGVEHGFVLTREPEPGVESSAGDLLCLELRVRGGLRPEVASEGRGLCFRDMAGRSTVTYSGLRVWDADARELPAHFSIQGALVRLAVDARGARFPITIDPVAQQAYLKASNTGSLDNFGKAVAFSGDTVVVAAPGESSSATGVEGNQLDDAAFRSGAAYVFVRAGGTWTQQAYLKASNTGPDDLFGEGVAIDGDTIVIGAPTEDSNASGVNGTGTDPRSNYDAGAAYVFVRHGTTWSQQAYLKASNPASGVFFGSSVAVSGDTILVGARGENTGSAQSGAAYVFVRSGTSWSQQALLKASNASGNDLFGNTVALHGDTAVVGAPFEDGSATGINGNQADDGTLDSGAAYVFTRSGTTWSQQAYVKASNPGSDDRFGTSVAIDGDTLAVGAYLEDGGAGGINGNQTSETAVDAGAVYVFTRTGNNWAQQAFVKPSIASPHEFFGLGVGLSGDLLVVGGYGHEAVYLFTRAGSTWSQSRTLTADNAGILGSADQFGIAVALSGSSVLVGAPQEDSSATGVNGDGTNDNANQAGAAYVFLLTPDAPEIAVASGQGDGLLDGTGTLTFANTYVGVAGPPQSLIISNVGSATLTGLAFSFDGPHASDFSVTTNGVGPSLAAHASAMLSLTFNPTGIGERTATLHIASNDSDENPFDVNLMATAGPANAPLLRVMLLPSTSLTQGTASVAFGNVLTGGYRDRIFRLQNLGGAALQDVSASLTGPQAEAFTITQPPDAVIDSNSHRDCIVRYLPDAPGSHTASLAVASSDAAQSPFVITLQGVTVSPAQLAQQAYLKASNTGESDTFGYAVALEGDTLVVGAPGEDSASTGVNGAGQDDSSQDSGAAYVFVRTGPTWVQQAYLKASNAGDYDAFGSSVALSGDTLVVGAPGEDGNGLGVNPADPANNDANDSGAAYVFQRAGGNWTQQALFKASNTSAGHRFGYGVALSGDTAAVAAPSEGSGATGINGDQQDDTAPDSGAVYVFTRNATTWTQQAYLKASNTDPGDSFGSSIALSGESLVVGARNEASRATGVNGDQDNNTWFGAGAAYVFARNGNTWAQQAYLKPHQLLDNAPDFGISVAIDADTIVVGADQESGAGSEVNSDPGLQDAYMSGAAYVFVRVGSAWSPQAYLKAPNAEPGDAFGYSVAVKGDLVVVGAPFEASAASTINGNQADNSAQAGAAYLFSRSAGAWSPQAYLKPSNTDPGDSFGWSVALSGQSIALGASYESSDALGINGDGSNNNAPGSGAAYVLTSSSTPSPPRLSATIDGSDVLLTWSQTRGSFQVERSAVIQPASWNPVAGTPTTNGGTLTLRLPRGENQEFFRLHPP